MAASVAEDFQGSHRTEGETRSCSSLPVTKLRTRTVRGQGQAVKHPKLRYLFDNSLLEALGTCGWFLGARRSSPLPPTAKSTVGWGLEPSVHQSLPTLTQIYAKESLLRPPAIHSSFARPLTRTLRLEPLAPLSRQTRSCGAVSDSSNTPRLLRSLTHCSGPDRHNTTALQTLEGGFLCPACICNLPVATVEPVIPQCTHASLHHQRPACGAACTYPLSPDCRA